MGRIPKVCHWLSVPLLALAAGCAVQGPASLPACPGKVGVSEALSAVRSRVEQAVAFRASGQCRLAYYVPDDEGVKRHNLPVLLWFNPPSEVYLQGSIAVDPKAVVIGSNAEAFWLALRPKEMSAYYWGTWDEAQNVEGLMVSPQVVLEAFGIVQHDDGVDANDWSLTKEGEYDVLIQHGEGGRILKRVYIYTCDYLVRKIEYFGADGQVIAVAQLDGYKPLAEGFHVPTDILVKAMAPDGREDTIDIKLSSIKAKELSEQARRQVFTRDPNEVEKFEQVYRYRGGDWVSER
ncbi:MAG TPA: hypothetical protein PLU87_18100 [Sedimentisphaerales bacterium]|nr:hypothetical protein [Sedimentisphaerales bacterium]HRS12925.1 hypothetical protein [Sedimentisphaerales bacterium]HRV49537.1 hypothetical protein [Sedimentisphaerales bacterium]